MKRNKKDRHSTGSTVHYYVSQQGLESLEANLNDLRARRKEQVSALTAIREQQSDEVKVEDASYIYAMSVIEFIDNDIERFEQILAHAKVVESEQKAAEAVALGSHVKLQGKDKSFEYTIVQSFEADPSVGKISTESPLGRQLLGKRLRDKITFHYSQRHKPMSLKLVAIK